MSWIIKNKEWLFSGVGLVIISFFLSYFLELKDGSKQSNSNSNSNIQSIVGDNNTQIIKPDNTAVLKEIKKLTVENEKLKIKNLLDAVLLGRYHFSYESFLMMKLDKKNNENYEKESLNILKKLVHKFKLPVSILDSINKLSKVDNEKKLMAESTKITSSIYFSFMVDNPIYGYLYVLAISKATYLKLEENKFPQKVLDIFKLSAKKQAENLNLPNNIVSNITDKSISYEDIVDFLTKEKIILK